jgi:branched-chain amino acid transport system substrate-binding protein
MISTTPEDWKKLGPALVRTGSWSPSRTIVIEVFKDPATLKELGDPATQGLRGVSPTNAGSPSQAAFDALFKRYAPSSKPTGFDSLGFDPVVAAFLASLRAKSDDPAKIKENLQAISGPPGVKIKPNQLGLAIRTILAGKEIDYQGAWGNLDWNKKGDPGSSIFEFWRYPGGGADIPPGQILVVKAPK